ncbi:exosome complex protein Rrp42 [Candidatus Woesearchaeota archaeon]|nr:exosome complex protein Rrp42 [Candidatus Woesearchaeota archaeon]
MNKELHAHMIKFLERGSRYDGRKPLEYRDILVEYGIVKNAEGSARVKIGETEVITGVKLVVDKPYPDTPEQGSLMVGAEFLPIANPDFEVGPPGIAAVELARVVDRGIRESKAIDVKKLCITAQEKVWTVIVDICTVNDAGNLFDVSALSAIAALQSTKFPEYADGKIQYGKLTDTPLPLADVPIEVTVFKIGKSYIVDPTPDEEKVYDARLTVAISRDGRLCALQKGGDVALSEDDIFAMIDIAAEKQHELREKLEG